MNMELQININLDDLVEVELTEYGLERYNHHYITIPGVIPKTDPHHITNLWKLFEVFGRYTDISSNPMFKKNIICVKSKLKK